MKQLIQRLWCLALFTFAGLSSGQVLINEIMYRPAGVPEDVGQEWVELYNAATTNVDLSGWQLTKGAKFTFPPGAAIVAHGYLVVAASAATFHATYPAVTNYVGDWTGGLGNNGDTVRLQDSHGQTVNSVTYGTEGDWAMRCVGEQYPGKPTWWRGWGWTNSADGVGSTYELMNPALPSDSGQNWSASRVTGGTPGSANSVMTNDLPPMIFDLAHVPAIPTSNDVVTVHARIVDEAPASTSAVRLYYRLDGQTTFAITNMFDDGAHGDGLANDGVFGAILPPRPDKAIVEFYVQATDAANHARTWPGPTDANGTQGANALYQVDQTAYTGSQGVYRMIATAADTNAWLGLMDNVSSGQYANPEMNATIVLSDSTGTDIRYRVGVRNRGAGTRSARPHNLHFRIPNDNALRKYRGLDFNSRTVHSQVAGNAVFNSTGLANAYGTPVQVRFNSRNLANASPSGTDANTFQFGSYYCFEPYSADWAQRQFPNDGNGNIYKGTWYFDGVGLGVGGNLNYLGTDPIPYEQLYSATGPSSSTGAYSKQSNVSADDWTDLINLTYTLNQTSDGVYTNTLNQVANIDQWFRFIAVNTLLCTEETTLATGAGDDYSMYRGMVDPRFILLAHDEDTVLGQGDTAPNYTKSIFDAAIGGGSRPGIPALNRLMKHPLYAPRYYEILKELCETSFAPAQINSVIQQSLRGWVPDSYIQSMQLAAYRRRTNVLNQIPSTITISNTPAVLSGYPHTNGPAIALYGTAPAIDTRFVVVAGVTSIWSAWNARWTNTAVPLWPGVNRVLVQALNGNGVEFQRQTVAIWYDTATNVVAGGMIATNATWSPVNGIYRVTSNLAIGTGGVLTIQPGTCVLLHPGVTLTITDGGRLLAQGTDPGRIRFTHVPGATNWGSLDFLGATNESRLVWVDFEACGGTTISGHNAEVHVNNSKVFFDHLTFPSSPAIEYISFDNSAFIVQNSTFPTYPFATSAPEMLHGVNGIPVGGYGIFRTNYFGHTWGFNDTIDFTANQNTASGGGNRPGPVLQVINNVFDGAGDDCLDLDSTDAWIEGNIFMHVHRDTNRTDTALDTGSAISGGVDYTGVYSEWTILNNLFYDVDHVAMVKGGNRFIFVNNTVAHVNKEKGAGLTNDIAVFDYTDDNVPLPDPSIGAGTYIAHNVIWDAPALTANYNPTNYTVIFDDNILPLPWNGSGSNNMVRDPMLNLGLITNVATADWKTVKAALTPQPGSPALGTGLGGHDKGGLKPLGVLVYGEPSGVTRATSATLNVAAGGVFNWGTVVPPYTWGFSHYKWRLNSGTWSAETPLTTPISLSGLTNGQYHVEVVGKNDAGFYQNDPVFGPDAVVTLSHTWTVDTSLHRLIINEVLASNHAAAEHEDTFPDMIELFNDSAASVDLSRFGITEDPTQPFRYTFPNDTTLAAGQYLVLYADAPNGTAGLHLGFTLAQNGGGVYLFDPSTNLMDSVVYGIQLTDFSIGRLPDGSWGLNYPTLGSPNQACPTGDPSNLKINEWLAYGASFFLDDFIEIHNPQQTPVDLGRCYLTDDLTGWPDQFQVTPLSFVSADGYLVFIADSQPQAGADHLNFGLSVLWGQLALLAPDLSIIDYLYYQSQSADSSQGRSPDGAANVVFFPTPTPGAPNPAGTSPFTTNINTTAFNLVKWTNFWEYNDGASNLGTGWRAVSYNDSTWSNGLAMLYHGNGYTTGGPAQAPTNTWLRFISGTWGASQPTFYFRTAFNVATNPAGFSLAMSFFIDDGAVIYLNGQEAYRTNMGTGTIAFTNWAPTSVSGDATLVGPVYLPTTNLVQGTNVLAVEVHQNAGSSSDVTLAMTLDLTQSTTNIVGNAAVVLNEVMANNQSFTNQDGSTTDWVELYNPGDSAANLADTSLSDDSSTPRRWVFPTATSLPARGYLVVRFDGNAPASTHLTASFNTGFGLKTTGSKVYLFDTLANGGALLDSVVFGLQAPDFALGRIPNASGPWTLCLPTMGAMNVAASLGTPTAVKVNEWMASAASGSDWFELYNSGNQPVALGGYYLTPDLNNRTKDMIPAHSFIGTGGKGFMVFQADNKPASGADHVNFKLTKSGSSIGLFTPNGTLLDGVTYGTQTTGISQGRLPDGNSTVVFFPETATPGNANYLPLTAIAINEALSHTDSPLEDAIELRNLSDQALNIGGWWLSDANDDPKRFRIPDGTILTAGGYAVFFEDQLNPWPWHAPSFSLNGAKGDEIYLSQADAAGNLTGYRATVSFGPQVNGVSFGRYETSLGTDFVAMSQRTFGVDNPVSTNDFVLSQGLPNPYPRVGPIVFNEIMYHPPDLGTNDNTLDEYLELLNITDTPVPLFNTTSPQHTWHLRDGVDFDFPTNVTVPPHGFLLVVSFNPTNAAELAAFRTKYGVSPSVAVFGPYQGKLANDSEGLNLNMPDELSPNGEMPYVLVERVVYADAVPWPSLADGNTNYPAGISLQRRSPSQYGNDPVNWFAAPPTAGATNGHAIGNPPVILTQPTDQVVTAGASVTLSVVASGDPRLVAQWRWNGRDILGATNATLLLANMQSTNDGSYSVRISNPAGTVVSTSAIIVVRSGPQIVLQPTNTTATPGSSAVLRAAASGPLPLRYQWRKGATSLSGATNAVLVFNPVQLSDAASYSVVISNDFGSVTSLLATLTANAAPAISLTSPTNGNAFTAPATITLSAQATDSSDGVARVDFYQGTTLLGSRINAPYSVTAANLPYGSYSFWAVATDLNGLSATSAVATVTVRAANALFADMFASRGMVFDTNVTVLGTNTAATKEANEPLINIFNGGGKSLWIGWIAPVAGPVSIDTFGSSFDTLLSVYTNAPGQSVALQHLVKVAENDDAPGLAVTQSKVQFTNFVPGQEYMITVDGFDGANGPVVLHISQTSWAPAIVTQPTNRTNNLGTTATFTVVAAGAGPLRYQWQFNTVNLPGQTNAALTLPNVQPANSGNYNVVVANQFGSVTSAPAYLLVRGPIIQAQPQGGTFLAGGTVTLSVGATGGSLTYQWRCNNTNLGGATGTSYTVNSIQTGQAGAYTVLISNNFGSVLSQPALVFVSVSKPVLGSPTHTGSDTTFLLTGTTTGDKCYVEFSRDLVSWTNLAVFTNLSGSLPVSDAASSPKQRFYRAHLAP